MIKVTVTSQSGRSFVRVEGAVDLHSVPELRRAVSEAVRPEIAGRIDLSGVTSVDAAGITQFRAFRANGWELESASLYIAMLLQESQSCPPQS